MHTLHIALSQGVSYNHASACGYQEAQRHHQLHDGLGQVDGADSIGADQLANDDAVDHVAQTPGKGDEDGRPQVSPEQGGKFLTFFSVHKRLIEFYEGWYLASALVGDGRLRGPGEARSGTSKPCEEVL